MIMNCVDPGVLLGGQTVDIECSFSSDSPVSVVWNRDGIPIGSSSNLVTQDSNGDWSTTYTIDVMDDTTIGDYSVSATNSIGTTDGPVIPLTVDCK